MTTRETPPTNAAVSLRFGKRVRELREARLISRGMVAAAIGISTSTLARWELGSRMPSYDALARLVRYLGVTYDELLK
jgi:transcriptional regulator with XRE-family HTH domain